MRVAWDPAKARANFLKHGVRFSDAEGVLYDPMALTGEDERSEGERRYVRKEYDFSGARQGAIVKQTGKTRITIYLDDDVLQAFRERAESAGRGYQTMINDALREQLGKASTPLDARTLRRILREELKRTG